MEVKTGYKQTVVGVIPEEWDDVTVQKLVDKSVLAKPLDGNHGNIHPKSSDYVHHGIPFVMANNFANGEVDFGSCKFITKDRAERLQKGFSISGDVLLTHKGTVGNTAIVGEMGTEYIMLTPQVTYYRVIDSTVLSNHYLRQYFDSQKFQSLFKSLAGGGTRAYLGIVKQLALPIVVPPLPEQRAIAEVLSDVDALLGALNKLIVKKRDLKQAAIQKLLTGQTRLPGFYGAWEARRLTDVFAISLGRSKSEFVVEDGDFWVCDMGSVSTDGRLIVSKRTNYRGDFLRRGDLIMPKDDIGGGNIIGKIGYIDANDTYILGDHVYCLRALEGDPRFLAYVINSHRVNSELRKKVIGSAQLGLGRKSVNEQEIQFPQTSEQTAISEVLTEMDAEMAALEQRREKTRALKLAMMQELLAGRTRLVTPKEAHV